MTVLTPEQTRAALGAIADVLDTLDNGDPADWLSSINVDDLRAAQAALISDEQSRPTFAGSGRRPPYGWPSLMAALGGPTLYAGGLDEPRQVRPTPDAVKSPLEAALFHECADLHAALGLLRSWAADVLDDGLGERYPLMPDAVTRIGLRWRNWHDGERWEAPPSPPVVDSGGHFTREGRHLRAECPACAE